MAPPTVSLGATQLVLPPSNKAVVLPVQLSGPAVVPLSVSLAVDDPNVKVVRARKQRSLVVYVCLPVHTESCPCVEMSLAVNLTSSTIRQQHDMLLPLLRGAAGAEHAAMGRG